MRLFVSALLAFAISAAGTAVSAQEYEHPAAQTGAATIEGLQNGKASSAQALADESRRVLLSTLAGVSQAGCPVTLTSARLNWPASYLPVTRAEKVTEPNLALGFQNSSGKAIRLVTITARLLGKHDIYQLDADAFDLRLTFPGVDAAGKAAEQLREIRVPATMHAYGVTRVSLEQVLFDDGSLWTAVTHNHCSLDVQGSAERVAK